MISFFPGSQKSRCRCVEMLGCANEFSVEIAPSQTLTYARQTVRFLLPLLALAASDDMMRTLPPRRGLRSPLPSTIVFVLFLLVHITCNSHYIKMFSYLSQTDIRNMCDEKERVDERLPPLCTIFSPSDIEEITRVALAPESGGALARQRQRNATGGETANKTL